jgi:phytoene dehydrogenase-like protein
MGSIEGHEGSWAYVRGGMGTITQALAKAAKDNGVEIFTE